MRSTSTIRRSLAAALLATLLALALGACGSDDDDGGSSAGGGGAESAQQADRAFLTGMMHHHMTAIEMAKIAQDRGQSSFVKGLADDIVSAQEGEIADMKRIYRRLFGGTLKPDPGAHDGLGLTAEEAGMTHTPDTNEMLKKADPFDRAFIDEMVPHHTGAVRMAKVVLESTEDAGIRKLAEAIVSAQEREITEMNDFREKEYGAPAPEEMGEMEDGGAMPGMDH